MSGSDISGIALYLGDIVSNCFLADSELGIDRALGQGITALVNLIESDLTSAS